MSCNVLLHDSPRHTRTLPLLIDYASRNASFRGGLGSFTEAIDETHECAMGKRALSRCTPESRQTRAIGACP
jgi:hypothetical protein